MSLATPRLTATLLSVFAALALLVTGTGITGVIATSVSQRTQEFGVSMALGAGRASVLAMVLVRGSCSSRSAWRLALPLRSPSSAFCSRICTPRRRPIR